METEIALPDYDARLLTADQVSQVLNRTRSTVTGWVNRYDWLRIEPVKSGSTRRYSFAELGRLVALRAAMWAGSPADAFEFNPDRIFAEIKAEFETLIAGARSDSWGSSGEKRVGLFFDDDHQKLLLISRSGSGFTPTRNPDTSGAYVADLAGYVVPQLTLHLGQDLRNAWNRALFLLHGYELDD